MLSRNHLFLFGVLTLTVLAAIRVSEMQGYTSNETAAPVTERVTPRRQDATNKPPQQNRVALAVDKLSRPPMTVGDFNPFGTKSWYTPPPPAPEPPPPKPTAPPLPFTYIGKMQEEGGQWVVYFAKGDQFFTVAKGQTFDNVYRLEGIENGNIVIQYLPLSIKQLLPINAES
ncbi:MAG: hypothetical protein V4568_19415 [Pseudomonadota bacterium]